MLAIKLSQRGKKNKKMFRLVISEKNRDPFGRILESLGSYNPHSKELITKSERINYWLSKGAQMTPTVNNLLIENKVIEGDKKTASKPGKKSEKRQAQIQAKDEKRKVATEKEAETKKEEVKEEAKQENEKEETEEKKEEAVEENKEEK
jgi:small subunit ribosomal protein S16